MMMSYILLLLFSGSILVSAQQCQIPEYIMIADATNCAGYLQCYQNEVRHRTCFSGTLFNIQSRFCDFPSNVHCGTRSINGTVSVSTTPPSHRTTTLSPEKKAIIDHYRFWYSFHCTKFGSSVNIIRWPHPYNCQKFYECKKQKLTDKMCPTTPSNLFFSTEQQNCVILMVAKCPVSPPFGPNVVPSEEEKKYKVICLKNPNTIMRWPYTRDCRRYFQCTYGVFKQAMCPSRLVYNDRMLSCEVPSLDNLCALYWKP